MKSFCTQKRSRALSVALSFCMAVVALVPSGEATAQQLVSAVPVCQKLASSGSSYAATCAGIAARSLFTPEVVQIALTMTRYSGSSTISLLTESADQYFDPNVIPLCEKMVSGGSTSYGLDCIRAMKSTSFFDSLAAMPTLMSIARQSNSSAISGLKAVAGKYIDPSAVKVCEKIASYGSSSYGVDCLATIANKSFFNDAHKICYDIVPQSSSSAISCLKNIAADYVPPVIIPGPGPGPGGHGHGGGHGGGGHDQYIQVSTQDISDLMKNLSLAQRLLDQGNGRAAKDKIADALEILRNVR